MGSKKKADRHPEVAAGTGYSPDKVLVMPEFWFTEAELKFYKRAARAENLSLYAFLQQVLVDAYNSTKN